MDVSLFDPIAPGAIILSVNNYSLFNFINPSQDKHSSLYFGSGIITFCLRNGIKFPIDDLDNSEKYILEFNTNGIQVIPVAKFIQAKSDIKIYYYMEGLFPNYKLMKETIVYAFRDVTKRYGLGNNKTYCFKMIADSYKYLGIQLKSYKILGYDLFLSQSFSDDARWLKVVDTTKPESIFREQLLF